MGKYVNRKRIRAKRNIVQFELRPKKDDDIVSAIEKAIHDDYTRSDIIRDALRHFLLKGNNYTNKRGSLLLESSSLADLKRIEKDDTQLDDALDNLLSF